nr:PREDICTED: uncharacterized protein LOC100141711 [Tribolium castaneum]|eukprot:XP_015838988.1 PREDICTED: uncharacterized protein LOC100141711 [Tribolium castaneum]
MTVDFTALITEETLSKLKCDDCKNHLSHFPIYVSNDKKNICGRCSKTQENLTRNEVYEGLAQFIQFPCQYKNKGCGEIFFPKDIPTHEERCVFRIIECPTKHFTSCDWTGALPTVLVHCQNKHNELILKNGAFELDLAKSYKSEKLLEYESGVFIVVQKFYPINKLMEFTVRYPEYGFDIKEIPCKISFKTANRNVEVCGYTTRFEDDKVTEIYLDSLSDRNAVSTVIEGKIALDKFIDKPVINEQNDEFLALLKCSSCHRFALPPIYEVVSTNPGQPIYEVVSTNPGQQNLVKCAKCKPLVSLPSASTNMWGTPSGAPKPQALRNIALDNLANKLTFPCENEPNGCTFKAKPLQMVNHQISCPRGTYNCPVGEFVSCVWNGMGTEIEAHIEEVHSGLILKSSTVSEPIKDVYSCFQQNTSSFGSTQRSKQTNHVPNVSCYIIKFSNRFFRLNFTEKESEYHWAVQLIGPFGKGYMFELELADEMRKISLVTKQVCGGLTKKCDLFRTKNCYFSCNQITNFVRNNMITFNVKIYE